MNPEILAYVNRTFSELGINFSFMRKTGPVAYPYFVGEYSESPEPDESGSQKTDFILDGWTNGPWLDLEKAKNRIAVSLRSKTAIINGIGIAIDYSNSRPVPTEDPGLKRIQIVLEIRTWRQK